MRIAVYMDIDKELSLSTKEPVEDGINQSIRRQFDDKSRDTATRLVRPRATLATAEMRPETMARGSPSRHETNPANNAGDRTPMRWRHDNSN